MLVLKKKQIVLATFCACLSIFAFMFTTAGNNTQKAQNTKETVSLPVSR